MCGLGDLTIGKLSPPIHSSELDVKLRDAQSPQDIPGCAQLDPLDVLSKHFSSPPCEHVHIIVQLPPPREYSRHLFIPPVCLNNGPLPIFHKRFILSHSPASPLYALPIPTIQLLHIPQDLPSVLLNHGT
jgi:hypothetical protein